MISGTAVAAPGWNDQKRASFQQNLKDLAKKDTANKVKIAKINREKLEKEKKIRLKKEQDDQEKILLAKSDKISLEANTLGGKVTWVDENASMNSQAKTYNDLASQAHSNISNKKGQAPSLIRTLPDGTKKTVRFDGLEGNVLVDRKISVVTTSKAKEQALRQSEALRENGLTGRWEVPSEQQASRARKIFEELNIKNIEVKIAQ